MFTYWVQGVSGQAIGNVGKLTSPFKSWQTSDHGKPENAWQMLSKSGVLPNFLCEKGLGVLIWFNVGHLGSVHNNLNWHLLETYILVDMIYLFLKTILWQIFC